MSSIYYNNKKISSTNAKDIKYDNTNTSLESGNLQEVIDELNTNLTSMNSNLIASDSTQFRFAVDKNGKYGYVIQYSEGADTVIPFKTGEYIVQSGTTGATSITNSYQGRTSSGTIKFPSAFPSTPSCMIQCTNSNYMCIFGCSATTTGINWTIYNTNSASAVNTYIKWVAWLSV